MCFSVNEYLFLLRSNNDLMNAKQCGFPNLKMSQKEKCWLTRVQAESCDCNFHNSSKLFLYIFENYSYIIKQGHWFDFGIEIMGFKYLKLKLKKLKIPTHITNQLQLQHYWCVFSNFNYLNGMNDNHGTLMIFTELLAFIIDIH